MTQTTTPKEHRQARAAAGLPAPGGHGAAAGRRLRRLSPAGAGAADRRRRRRRPGRLAPGLLLGGDAAGDRRKHPQGHAGDPDHALRGHAHRRLDGQRHHPHAPLLRPEARLAALLPGHRLRRPAASPRWPPAPRGARWAPSAWRSSASPRRCRCRWGRRRGRSWPAPTSATSCRPFPTSPTWPRSRPGRTSSTTSATCCGRPCRPGWPAWPSIFSWAWATAAPASTPRRSRRSWPACAAISTFHAVLLLPLAIVFWFAFAKKPVIPGMVLSVAVAAVLAAWLQRVPLVSLARFLSAGYKADTGPGRRRPPDLARRHHEHDGDAAHRPGRLQLRRHHAAHRHAGRGAGAA